MKLYDLLLLITLAVVVSATGVSASKGNLLKGDYRYEDAERMRSFEIRNANVIFDLIDPSRRLRPKRSGIEENIGLTARDCSDVQFRCMNTGSFVLAVPNRELRENDRYEVLGNQIVVKECLRGYRGICQVALVEADCQNMPGVDACEVFPAGREHAPHPGERVYFIYNEDYGIISIGFFPMRGKISDIDARRIARQYVLKGDHGLLEKGQR